MQAEWRIDFALLLSKFISGGTVDYVCAGACVINLILSAYQTHAQRPHTHTSTAFILLNLKLRFLEKAAKPGI